MFGGNKTPFGGTSSFGTGNTSFGGATPAPGGFGTPNAFGQSTPAGGLFGANPSTSTAGGLFSGGTSSFGQPSSTGFSFGNKAPSASGSLFGGTSTSTGGGLFPTPSASTSFGGTTAFGAGGGNKPLFGTSTSSTSLFGQPATSTTPFGQTTTQPSGGLFGATSAGGLFGSTQQQNGTTIKFTPTTGSDTMVKNGASTNVNTKHQVITAMKEYTNKSFEELRMEDYLANRKGGSSGGGLLGATGMTQPDNKATGLFGQPASTASNAFNFGQNKSTFGSTAPTSFGTGSSLFGSNTNQQQQQQQQQQQSGGLFGNKPLFGQTTTSTAGSGLFGQSAGTSLFGQNQNQQKSLFGATSQTPGTGLFGSTPAAGTTGFGTGGFGTSTFGQQNQGGLFGKSTPNFGTPASQPGLSLGANTGTVGLFGGASKPGLTLGTGTGTGFGTTGFGGGTGTGSSLFGGNKGTTGFGTTGLSGGGFGGNLGSTFGGGTSGSLFGGNKPTGLGTTFGNTGTFGGGLGGTTGLTGGGLGAASMIGGQQANVDQNTQVQQQLMTLFNSPYGDNPLFKNILVDSDKKKDVLPGSSAQKSLSSPSHYKVSARPGAKLRPKLLQRGGGKSKLFDGLEEEDNTLNSETFVTRRSIKKLVIKNKGSQDDSRNDSFGQRSSVKPDELASPLPVYPREQSRTYVRLTPEKDDDHPRQSSEEPNTPDIPLFSKPKVLEDTSGMESPGNKHEDPDCTIHVMNAQPKRQQRKPSGSGAAPPSPPGSSPPNTPPSSTREPLNQSIGSLGDASLEISGEDEVVDQENQPPPHPAKVVLRRPGYYTIPTLGDLAELTDADGNCFVDDFSVGRERYGSVFFPGMTNVKGLNLDEIVHFRRKEITIYPDDTCKPTVGTGLNKKAEVTLDATWPIDKSNRQPIKDPERLASLEYEERLERATAKLGAKFIEYRPETGSWVFMVQHFSKYGLTDSDEEDGGQGQTQQQQVQKGVKKVDKAPSKDPTKLPPTKQREEQQKSSSTRAPLQENGSIHYLAEEPMREELDLNTDTVPDRAVPRSRGLGGQQDQFMAGEAGDFDTYMPYDDADRDMQTGQDEVIEGGQRSLDVSHRLAEALGVSSHRMQVMKASFFGEEEEDQYAHSGSFAKAPGRDGEKRAPRPSREPLFEREQTGDMWQASMMGSPAKFLAGMSSPALRGRVASPIPRFLRESMDTRDQGGYVGQAPVMPGGMSPHEKIPKIVGSRPHLGLVPVAKSVVCERHNHIADAGLMMGRSFRVGWGPNWTLVHSGNAVGVQGFRPKVKEEPMPFTLLTSKSTVKPTTESSPFKVTLEKVNIAPMFGKPGRTTRMYERSLKVALEHSLCATEKLCPAFTPQSGTDALHRYAIESVKDKKEGTGDDTELLEHTRLVWALMVALWGQLPEESKGPLDPTSYPYRKARRKAMSQWLSDSCRKHIDNEVQDSKFRHLGHVEAIFALLTGRLINEACLKSQESGDHRLALLLAQAGATHESRHLVATQLIHWEQLRADQFIADEYLKVYSLLAGQLVWQSSTGGINICEDLDWKRALAVHLWYHNSQEASIADALLAFEDGFTGKSALGDYCLPPRPPYMESNPGFYREDLSALESMDEGDGLMPSRDRFPVWDMCYHLLKLYCDRMHHMHNVLAPTAHSPYQLDYRLSWHALQVLQALGYSHLSPHRQAHLTISYASQLESIGLWHWAAFVLLHVPNDLAREDLLRSLLGRHITLELSGDQLTAQESFLISELKVPVEWIHNAKALRALYEGREREEAWHLLRAGRWNDCHMVLIKKIAADAIINESYGFLKGVLDELSDIERSVLIQDWSTNGQVYLDFININQRLEELARREPTTFEVEKLHPDIASLCLRVGGVYCQTVKDRVCRSEIAKRTANMMKAVLTLQQESLASAAGSSPTRGLNPLIPSRLLAPHVTKLPLPEDYSLQELRQLTRSYTQELTA